MDNIIDKIKMIIKNKEPNKIISIECDFSDMSGCNDYNYYNLVNYWKYIENNKIENNSLFKEYSNIKDFKNKTNFGIFSLFYFKNSKNCLAVGKFNDEMFHLDIKCPEYQKVLSEALTSENELFVLSYWIF